MTMTARRDTVAVERAASVDLEVRDVRSGWRVEEVDLRAHDGSVEIVRCTEISARREINGDVAPGQDLVADFVHARRHVNDPATLRGIDRGLDRRLRVSGVVAGGTV